MSARLTEYELAQADDHVVAALAIINGRASTMQDRLIAVSDWLWTQRRQHASADDALARVRVIQRARCAS
jgi:hypothetical protein